MLNQKYDLQETEVESIEQFAERLVVLGQEVSLPDCFAAAADLSVYLTAVRNKSLIQASRYLPGTIKSVGEQAVSGDLDAARLLFDYLGVRAKQSSPQVATQINVTVPSLQDIIEIGPDGNIVKD